MATLEHAGRLGHRFGQVRVSAPGAAAQPIQAAGLHEGYMKTKGLLVSARKKVGGYAGKVAGAIKGTKAFKAGAGAVDWVKDKKDVLSEKIEGNKYYQDLQKIGQDSGFRKLRGVMGVLGLAGGYQQGTVHSGIEGRQAFADSWEKYFAGLSPEKEAAARQKYSGTSKEEMAARKDLEEKQADWKTQQRLARRRRIRERRGEVEPEPQGVEMQPLSRFGDEPFEEVEREDAHNVN